MHLRTHLNTSKRTRSNALNCTFKRGYPAFWIFPSILLRMQEDAAQHTPKTNKKVSPWGFSTSTAENKNILIFIKTARHASWDLRWFLCTRKLADQGRFNMFACAAPKLASCQRALVIFFVRSCSAEEPLHYANTTTTYQGLHTGSS
jgi:hypothetical protein